MAAVRELIVAGKSDAEILAALRPTYPTLIPATIRHARATNVRTVGTAVPASANPAPTSPRPDPAEDVNDSGAFGRIRFTLANDEWKLLCGLVALAFRPDTTDPEVEALRKLCGIEGRRRTPGTYMRGGSEHRIQMSFTQLSWVLIAFDSPKDRDAQPPHVRALIARLDTKLAGAFKALMPPEWKTTDEQVAYFREARRADA